MEKKSLRQEILQIAQERYGAEPEYLWPKYPEHFVLRQTSNRKWFAIIMSVPKNKLGFLGSERVDIMNVKADPYLIGSLRLEKGIFPAYHMNKANWLSILLDGTVELEKIINLLDMSFALTRSKAKNVKYNQSA